MRRLEIAHETWPIAGTFTISRGSRTAIEVVVATLSEDGVQGRGECVPYPRYNETVNGVMAALEQARREIEAGLSRADIASVIDPKAAGNALDCALWDLEAKQTGMPVWQRLGCNPPAPLITAYTLSLDTPEAMARAAREAAHRPLLKLKLGRDGDHERLAAIREAAPKSRLIVDANEGWRPDSLEDLLARSAAAGVEMVEQPLPATDDGILKGIHRAVPVCADESAHDRSGLAELAGKYDAINIKLDKTGGLTEAMALAKAAKDAGFKLMAGCMVATSLAMAPAMLIGGMADVVDLDGPLLLGRDRDHPIVYEGSLMLPAPRELWG
jgi:L-alanine-DL-glutamate epimerase-like enolase superfamily enzyme